VILQPGPRPIGGVSFAAPAVTGAAAAFMNPVASAERDALVEKYAHLVKYVVGRLGVSIPGVFDREDAMQAGTIGLLRAIDGYRSDSAASFESYAIVRIRGTILDAVRALDSVGRAGREAGRAISLALRELETELGRMPEEVEVAARLGVSVDRYREQLAAASVITVSLDEPDPRSDDEDGPNGFADAAVDRDAVDPGEEAARRDDVATLAREVARLGDRQKLVLALYYQDELTFREIGEVLGVTESRVCQIHTEAVIHLRNRMLEPDVLARFPRRRTRR
jgi:RNA polymerase sigma factor for flagellar operon FliA